jgi:D-glycero-alpha-D-manno-heptose-7-phosphate kinase
MIVARSPLRISLGGGGTDLPSYYREHTGMLIAAAIDKYIYIILHRSFAAEIVLRYSQVERVKSLADIQHPIFREALRTFLVGTSLEITSMADIPAGTGLGSSGSFTTALLKALYTYTGESISREELACHACRIEIQQLKRPVGKQDPYVAAYGGLKSYRFFSDERVEVADLRISAQTLNALEDNLLLFFSGTSRSAPEILEDQKRKSLARDGKMISNLNFIKELGEKSAAALESGNLAEFADLMNVHWEFKRRRSDKITNSRIDELYQLGRSNGAIGGKLVGAGGGGFLMFYAEETERLRRAMRRADLQEVGFKFDSEGTCVLLNL